MTVPFKFAIPLLLIVPLAAWFSGTRKYDFMIPRSIPASELRPEFASPVDREIADSLAPLKNFPPEKEAPKLPEIEFGDLQSPPELDEYRSSAELGAPALLSLAQRLQNTGHVQRAVLAYERILDSTPTGGSAQFDAEDAIATLKTTLPMWNSDPEATVPIEIHLDTARDADSLRGSIATLTELITVSSGNQCRPSFVIRNSPQPSEQLPSLPVAIWMTIPGEDPEKPSLAVATITPRSDEELDGRLTHGLYRLLVRRVTSIGQLTPPPPIFQGDDPENAIVNKVTRLAWAQILTTPFQSLEEGPPAQTSAEDLESESEDEPSQDEE